MHYIPAKSRIAKSILNLTCKCNSLLCKFLFQSMKLKIISSSVSSERRFSSWIGGSILASLVSLVIVFEFLKSMDETVAYFLLFLIPPMQNYSNFRTPNMLCYPNRIVPVTGSEISENKTFSRLQKNLNMGKRILVERLKLLHIYCMSVILYFFP